MKAVDLSAHLEDEGGISFEGMMKTGRMHMLKAIDRHGWSQRTQFILLTSPKGQTKSAKAMGKGYAQFMLHLEADRIKANPDLGVVSESIVTCPHATHGERGCASVCLTWSGRGSRAANDPERVTSVHRGRERRTRFLYDEPEMWARLLWREMHRASRWAARRDVSLVFRLNGTSDLRWERIAPWAFEAFPNAIFLDYTKWDPAERSPRPTNYLLAWSAQAWKNPFAECLASVEAGMPVSMICDDPELLLERWPDLFVEADKADTWIIQGNSTPVIGLLYPKLPMSPTHPTVYRAAHIYKELTGI